MSVSVVIPCYNARRYLGETVSSILSQTRLPDEIVFVDDGSTDHTKYMLEYYAKIEVENVKISVYWNEENKGIGYTRQKGIDVADGDYIVFLSSDDVWHKDFLKTSMNIVEPNLGTYTDYYRCDPKLNPVKIFRCPEFSKENVIDWALRKNMFINFSSIVFPKYLPVMFEPNLRRGEDLIFLLDTIIQGFKWVRIDTPLVYYRVMKRNFDYDKFFMVWKYNRDRLIKLGVDSGLVQNVFNKANDKVLESKSTKLLRRLRSKLKWS